MVDDLARPAQVAAVRLALARGRVVLLAGPRQAGKTTIARRFVHPSSPGYFDLENPVDVRRLDEPMTALGARRGVVVLDEIQRRPELFPVLRVLADRHPAPARFLVLGSASGDLLRQSSESLAGRLEVIELGGFTLDEVGRTAIDRLWRRGGFPRAFLARSEPPMDGCIVLDVTMPGLDGLELQARLRQAGQNLPIVFLTGYGDIPMTVRAIKSGATDFLTKPVSSEVLVGAVRAALEQAAADRQARGELVAQQQRGGAVVHR